MNERNPVPALLLSLLALLLTVSTAGAGGFNLAGVGAKALAMSGAFRGVADDFSAMYWNPAGLAGQGTALTIEGKLLYPMAWVTPDAPPTNSVYEGYNLYLNGVEKSVNTNKFPSGALGFQLQVNDRLTTGLAVFAPAALGTEWENLFLGPYPGYGADPAYPAKDWSSDMKVIDIHPTVGYSLTDKVSVGLGIGVKYGTVTLQSPKVVPSNDGTGNRLPLPAQDFFIDSELDGDGWGFGFNIGLLMRATDRFRIGFSYNGPTTLPLSGTVRQTLYMPRMAGAGTVEVEPDADADMPLPMDAGLGFSYDVTNRLTLAADFVWTNWKALDELEIKMDGTGLDGGPAENSTLVLNWEDTFRMSFGLNWVVDPASGDALRAGYYYDPTPIPEETVRPTITDVADKHNVSLGGLYHLGKNVALEGYWEHLFSVKRTAAAADNDGDNLYDNVPGDWKMQVDTFGFQFDFWF